MITNQLSFIFTPLWPTCGRRRRRLPEAQPQVCCGLHLTKLAHGLWSRLSCYHILSDPHWLSWMFYIKKKKMNLHVFILLIFVHLYRFVLGLFVCFVVFCCCCCTVMISSEMTLFQVSLCFSPFSSLPSGFSHLKKMNLHTAARTSGGFCEACCWTAGHICVASNRQSETLRLLKILNKLQMSVWFDTSEVWIFNFSCYVIQLFWWTRGSLLADVWSSSFWLQLWLEEWVT